MFIRKSKIKDYVNRHRQQENAKVLRECESKIKEIEQSYRTQMMLAQKDYEIELEELRQIVKYYKQREKMMNDQQNRLIKERAAVAEASSKLYNWMNMLGEVIIKSGRECQGIFENVDRMLKIDENKFNDNKKVDK